MKELMDDKYFEYSAMLCLFFGLNESFNLSYINNDIYLKVFELNDLSNEIIEI